MVSFRLFLFSKQFVDLIGIIQFLCGDVQYGCCQIILVEHIRIMSVFSWIFQYGQKQNFQDYRIQMAVVCRVNWNQIRQQYLPPFLPLSHLSLSLTVALSALTSTCSSAHSLGTRPEFTSRPTWMRSSWPNCTRRYCSSTDGWGTGHKHKVHEICDWRTWKSIRWGLYSMCVPKNA